MARKPLSERALSVCGKIKDCRLKAGYTQNDVAKYLGMNVDTYATYERCVAEPSLDTIFALCNLYKESFDEWLGISAPLSIQKDNNFSDVSWLDNLKKMKKQSGLTTKEIAIGSKIPEPTLEKIFAGKTKDPKLETIKQLVYFLGYTLDDLDEKKSSEPEESPEDFEAGIKLYNALIRAGVLKEGEDLTPKQVDILESVAVLISKLFDS